MKLKKVYSIIDKWFADLEDIHDPHQLDSVNIDDLKKRLQKETKQKEKK